MAAFDAAIEASKDCGKPLLIVFTANFCPACKKIAPIFDHLAGEHADSITLKKVDVDVNSEASTDIDCMPTYKLYKNGEEVERLESASEACISDLINRAKE